MRPARRVALAADAVRQLIPEGSNRAILAALATLAELGGVAALRAVEAHLATAPLAVDYGDRDSDPLPWELDRGAYALLVRWWARLGLAEARGAHLAAAWLGDEPLFEVSAASSYTLFTQLAPLLAPYVAPPLIAACGAGRAERRARAAGGLRYAPTSEALDALVTLLDDHVEQVANQARSSLSLLAYPASPGSPRRGPSAPDAVALRLLACLTSRSPAVRLRALGAFAWFAGVQHRNSITLPPHVAQVLPAMARLLRDPDAEVQRLAAKRIVGAGRDLDNLRPSRAAALGLRLPALDLLPLLDHDDPQVVLAALYLAGRHPPEEPPPNQGALAGRILARLDRLRDDPFAFPAALYALGRLGATAAIPLILRHLEQPAPLARIDALLVLARLRYAPALPHLVQLLHDLTYRADAREALDCFPSSEVLPLVLAQLRASRRGEQGCIQAGLWEVSYLEAHGDSEALALLRQTENYRFAARYIGAERDEVVAAARRLERRLLLAAGVPAEAVDDPLAAVQRILTAPLHPAECEAWGDGAEVAPHGEQRARWRNLCVALEGWLLAEPPPLGPALAEAERLLAGVPDEVREAHERWWLDVARGGQLGLPRLSAVARARLSPKPPWRLARAVSINEGISGALEPSAIFTWPGLAQIALLRVDHPGWLRALAQAPASFAPRVLRAGIYDDAVAEAVLAWPGLARLERLEVLWSRTLSDEARASLQQRTLAPRRTQVWRTPEGTYLVPRGFVPVHDSYGGWIARADGSILAVATTYAELTARGELVRVYGGPSRYYSPEETIIGAIFEVVGGALQQYEWHEPDRPEPGRLTASVAREGLVLEQHAHLPHGTA
jgi:HEAT repeat protein